MAEQHTALLELELASAVVGSLVDAGLADYGARVQEAEHSYSVWQLAIREEQVALQESEVTARLAAVEGQEARVASEMEIARGLSASTAARVRKETLEETAQEHESMSQ